VLGGGRASIYKFSPASQSSSDLFGAIIVEIGGILNVGYMSMKTKMKVLLLSRYGYLGASSRIRSYQYIPYLKENGIDVRISPLCGDNYLKAIYAGKKYGWKKTTEAYIRRLCSFLKAGHFDLLWIEKELFPWIPVIDELLLSFVRVPYVVDHDDSIVFHRYDLNRKMAVRLTLGRKIYAIMRGAACVIVGNDYIAQRARQSGAKRIEYLPSVIDSKRYTVKKNFKSDVFTVGWMGSPSSTEYIPVVLPAIQQLSHVIPIRFLVIGAGKFVHSGVNIDIRDWSEENEISDLHEFDVGIMPLFKGPKAEGKSGYKLVQYMACGLPVVASPIGVNTCIVDVGVNGFLPESSEEWKHVLLLLSGDRQLRERMGKAGRDKVEKKYCIQITGPRLASILKNSV